MSLAQGTRLGRYEVLEPLGKGGMGEVYRAKDTQLGREVAIKVLPEHLTQDTENIFLLRNGRIKILDFGLARRATPGSQEEVTEAPTKSQITEFGVVMGTIPYMSPEQVCGESLDARSDIFSMGSILYEMVTGKRPFSGNSTAEITAAILKEEPAKPEATPPEVNPQAYEAYLRGLNYAEGQITEENTQI